MTHADIYEKFMIEYDKADTTSSYPSLTEYEIATLLDKAYLALIAQKITGNNTRRVGFEGDLKATEDLRPLITTTTLVLAKPTSFLTYAPNEKYATLSTLSNDTAKVLYYLQSVVLKTSSAESIQPKLISSDPVSPGTEFDSTNDQQQPASNVDEM